MWAGRWFFFFFSFPSSFEFSTPLVSDPRTLHSRQSPHTLPAVTHSWLFPHRAGHFIHLQIPWDEMSCFCGACRSISLHCSLSTTSCRSLLIPPSLSLWFPPPCPAVNLPPCDSFPPLLSTSSPSTAPSHARGCRCLLYAGAGGGRPTDCKERDNWSFSLIGSPDRQHQGWERADSYERQTAAVTE